MANSTKHLRGSIAQSMRHASNDTTEYTITKQHDDCNVNQQIENRKGNVIKTDGNIQHHLSLLLLFIVFGLFHNIS